jgi:hypothetical protein
MQIRLEEQLGVVLRNGHTIVQECWRLNFDPGFAAFYARNPNKRCSNSKKVALKRDFATPTRKQMFCFAETEPSGKTTNSRFLRVHSTAKT